MADKANLGMATTHELLRELAARGCVANYDIVGIIQHTASLSRKQLNYKTVDGETVSSVDRVWEGPRTNISMFNPAHQMVQVGWWYEPECIFIPVTANNIPDPTGSMSPVYCEIGD